MPSSASPTTTLKPLRAAGLLRDRAYVDGEWVAAADGAIFAVEDPATARSWRQVAERRRRGRARGDRRGRAGAAGLAGADAAERAAALRRWFELMHAERDDLALLLTSEQGKPLAEARGEVDYAAPSSSGSPRRPSASTATSIPAAARRAACSCCDQPVGVVRRDHALELPDRDDHAQGRRRRWRPAARSWSSRPSRRRSRRSRSPSWPSAPAARRRAQRRHRRRAAAIGGELLSNTRRAQAQLHRLDRGRQAAHGAACADASRSVSLELGGHAPVHRLRRRRPRRGGRGRDRLASSATPARPASAPTASTSRTASTTPSRESSRAAVAALKVGNGARDRRADQGPLIDDAALDKVEHHVADALRGGASCSTGGKRARARRHASSSRPCSPSVTRRDADRAARRRSARWRRCSASRTRTRRSRWPTTPSSASPATSTRATSAACWRVAEALEYGMVGVNAGVISTEVAPFGGVKESGIGREGGAHGHRRLPGDEVPLPRRPRQHARGVSPEATRGGGSVEQLAVTREALPAALDVRAHHVLAGADVARRERVDDQQVLGLLQLEVALGEGRQQDAAVLLRGVPEADDRAQQARRRDAGIAGEVQLPVGLEPRAGGSLGTARQPLASRAASATCSLVMRAMLSASASGSSRSRIL